MEVKSKSQISFLKLTRRWEKVDGLTREEDVVVVDHPEALGDGVGVVALGEGDDDSSEEEMPVEVGGYPLVVLLEVVECLVEDLEGLDDGLGLVDADGLGGWMGYLALE